MKIRENPRGELLVQGTPVKSGQTPLCIKWACRKVGPDNEFVYPDLPGLDKRKPASLRTEGVI